MQIREECADDKRELLGLRRGREAEGLQPISARELFALSLHSIGGQPENDLKRLGYSRAYGCARQGEGGPIIWTGLCFEKKVEQSIEPSPPAVRRPRLDIEKGDEKIVTALNRTAKLRAYKFNPRPTSALGLARSLLESEPELATIVGKLDSLRGTLSDTNDRVNRLVTELESRSLSGWEIGKLGMVEKMTTNLPNLHSPKYLIL